MAGERAYKYDWDEIASDYKKGMSLTQIREKYGCCIQHARHVILKTHVLRTPSEALLHKNNGWRKLSIMQKGDTRILSLPSEIIKRLGFKSDEPLSGKWKIDGKKLSLRIKKRKKALLGGG